MGSSPPKEVRTAFRMEHTSFSFPSSALNSAMFVVLPPSRSSWSCTLPGYAADWGLFLVMYVAMITSSCTQLLFLLFFVCSVKFLLKIIRSKLKPTFSFWQPTSPRHCVNYNLSIVITRFGWFSFPGKPSSSWKKRKKLWESYKAYICK